MHLANGVVPAPTAVLHTSQVLASALEHCGDRLTLPGVRADDFAAWCNGADDLGSEGLEIQRCWRLLEVRPALACASTKTQSQACCIFQLFSLTVSPIVLTWCLAFFPSNLIVVCAELAHAKSVVHQRMQHSAQDAVAMLTGTITISAHLFTAVIYHGRAKQ